MTTAAAPVPKTAKHLANVARAVHAVANDNRTIDWVLSERAKWTSYPQERALLYGVIRHYLTLSGRLTQFLDKPLRSKDQDIFCLLLVGAYQLQFSSMPIHAVINESVDAAGHLRKPWSRGLINAILRKESTRSGLEISTDQSFGHPAWLATALNHDFPDQGSAILQANNTQAPMVLRVNTSLGTLADYQQVLREAAIGARTGASSEAIILEEPRPSESLPGWQEGLIAVQDMGAQYAAQVLQKVVVAGSFNSGLSTSDSGTPIRMLDACAAPGGKLAHLHELIPAEAAEIIGIELSPDRITTTHAILQRLGHTATVIQGDASEQTWWDGIPFDMILLDAPCSGTGTIRRHPDIKLLLQPQTIEDHARLQLQMLNNLWQTLAPGGTLLYCTCSLLQAENDNVIGRFIEHSSDACSTTDNKPADIVPLDLPSGQRTRYGWQLLPTDPDTDGFYYALLHKL